MIKEKFELATKIMNELIRKYSKQANQAKNGTLSILMKINEKKNQFDMSIIEQIIKYYGPMVNLQPVENKKLSQFNAVVNQEHLCHRNFENSKEC